MTAFDTLFWLLVIMLAVCAYAIEAGVAVRHRPAVLSSMFSVVCTILYVMVIGDQTSLGGTPRAPEASLPSITTKEEPKPEAVADANVSGLFQQAAPVEDVEKNLPKGPFTDCENCPSMVAVPPGRFQMGSEPSEPGHRDTEGPVSVHIPYPYAVGRFEITRDQYDAFVEETRHGTSHGCLVGGRMASSASWQNPGIEQAGNHPVVCITWRDAKAYVAWLSKKTGKTYRLLSEAEWEFMARAGVKSTYAYGTALQAGNANFNHNRDGTIPVGFTTPNLLGIHDVHGNAWEMLEDCWNPDLSFNALNGKPTTLRGDCSQRVIRGGGWSSSALQSRLAARTALDPAVAANTVGFRIARTFD